MVEMKNKFIRVSKKLSEELNCRPTLEEVAKKM
jgi:DNA-directed RNA polymerase sigma subunit (sigma70/sigma32)